MFAQTRPVDRSVPGLPVDIFLSLVVELWHRLMHCLLRCIRIGYLNIWINMHIGKILNTRIMSGINTATIWPTSHVPRYLVLANAVFACFYRSRTMANSVGINRTFWHNIFDPHSSTLTVVPHIIWLKATPEGYLYVRALMLQNLVRWS